MSKLTLQERIDKTDELMAKSIKMQWKRKNPGVSVMINREEGIILVNGKEAIDLNSPETRPKTKEEWFEKLDHALMADPSVLESLRAYVRELLLMESPILQSSPADLEPIFELIKTQDEDYIQQAVELFNSLEGTNVEVRYTNRAQASTSVTVEIPPDEFVENVDGFVGDTDTPEVWEKVHPFTVAMSGEFTVNISRHPNSYSFWIRDYDHGAPGDREGFLARQTSKL
jgi:hypothetical protein